VGQKPPLSKLKKRTRRRKNQGKLAENLPGKIGKENSKKKSRKNELGVSCEKHLKVGIRGKKRLSGGEVFTMDKEKKERSLCRGELVGPGGEGVTHGGGKLTGSRNLNELGL